MRISRHDDAGSLPQAVQRIESLAGNGGPPSIMPILPPAPTPVSSVGAVPMGIPADAPILVNAAGVMFLTPDKQVLFLQRGPGGDHEGEWCFPGGGMEEGEGPLECAKRETDEETGHMPDVPCVLFARRRRDGIDFTTYLCRITTPYIPTLNSESSGYSWAPASNPPEPLHPGCRIALARLEMDELAIARAIRDGELTSPQHYENIALFALRITGTKTSYRKKLDEYVYRPPEHYLTEEFLNRSNGLTVVWEHPKTNVLDSREFAERVVGAVVLPYIVGDEVWGIAKIYDAKAAELMESEQLSTSPAVVFRDPGVNSKLELEDGSTLLIEGKPSLLDHLAICEKGVWDKGGEPSGVKTDIRGDTDVAEMTEKEKADAAAKADQAKADQAKADAAKRADEKLDKMLTHLDSIQKHCDSLSSRMDAFEEKEKKADAAKADAAKTDAEKEEEKKKADAAKRDAMTEDEKKKADAEEAKAKEVAADKAKKDAEEEEKKKADAAKAKADAEMEEKKKADAVKADAARSDDLDDIRQSLDKINKKLEPRSDDEQSKFGDAQARADSVFSGFGMRAPRPLDGESLLGYRRRLVGQVKPHSPRWKDIDINAIIDSAAFGVMEGQVYADADQAALHPADVPGSALREIKRQDTTGRQISTFVGPRTFISGMNRTGRMIRKFGPPRAA